MALIDKLSAIGNAIREKTGTSELLTLDQMPSAIQNITPPFDIDTINNILKNIQFCSPDIKRQGTDWNWLGVSVNSTTRDTGTTTTFRSYGDGKLRFSIELPSFSIPAGYCMKYDYRIEWLPQSSNSDYGDHYLRCYQKYYYSDNTDSVEAVVNNSNNNKKMEKFSGTQKYYPVNCIINDKTILFPQLYLSFSFSNGNSANGNLYYRFYNFRVELDNDDEEQES